MSIVRIFHYPVFLQSLSNIDIEESKKIIQTINAYSYVMAERTPLFKQALQNAEIVFENN